MNSDDLFLHLPKPLDDGAADHLKGVKISSLCLKTTKNRSLDIGQLKTAVLFIFPKAGSSLEEATDYKIWDAIPGARGCTPQSCAYRDLKMEFQIRGYEVYGLSVQSLDILKEVESRNHLGIELLSDEQYELQTLLNLPTFNYLGRKLIRRITLVIQDGVIKKVFYPVFPPNQNAKEVLAYLDAQ